MATIDKSASVQDGVSRSRHALLNGDTSNYDWDSGYTCHQLGSGSICVQLGQPYAIDSMKYVIAVIEKEKLFFQNLLFSDCFYGIVMIVGIRITSRLAAVGTESGTKFGIAQIPPVNPGKLSIFLDVQSSLFVLSERITPRMKYFIAFILNVSLRKLNF